MQARRTLAPGQKGAKKSLERYGEQLVCVRYRYDEQRRKRFTASDTQLSLFSEPNLQI